MRSRGISLSRDGEGGYILCVQPQKVDSGSFCGSLRTFARNFSNINFFLKILPVKFDELVMSEM